MALAFLMPVYLESNYPITPSTTANACGEVHTYTTKKKKISAGAHHNHSFRYAIGANAHGVEWNYGGLI